MRLPLIAMFSVSSKTQPQMTTVTHNHPIARKPIAHVAFTQSGNLYQIEKCHIFRAKDAANNNLQFVKYLEYEKQEMPAK